MNGVFEDYNMVCLILDCMDLDEIYEMRRVNNLFNDVVKSMFLKKWHHKMYLPACKRIIVLNTHVFHVTHSWQVWTLCHEKKAQAFKELLNKYWLALIYSKDIRICFNDLLERGVYAELLCSTLLCDDVRIRDKFKLLIRCIECENLKKKNRQTLRHKSDIRTHGNI